MSKENLQMFESVIDAESGSEKQFYLDGLIEQIKDLEKDADADLKKEIDRLKAKFNIGGAKKEAPKPKAKATPKKTAKKPRAKVSPEEKAEKKRKVSQATGKTLEECKEILAKYEALRGKTTAKDKQRVEKLEKEDKLIDGTTTKTAEATTETTTKTVPAKIKKEVNAIEKEAEREAKKEVETKGKTKTEVKKEVDKVTKEKIEEKVEEMTSDLADAGKKFIKSIQTEIAKYSKDDAKKFLLDIKSQVDTLLKAYGYGGEIENAVQHYNIAWAGGDRPLPEYARGGEVKDEYKDFFKRYEENEDNNAHLDNAIMLVSEFGTADELKRLMEIQKMHKKQGYLTVEQSHELYEIQKPYYRKMFAKGGKTTRGYHQDRARLSQEPWEQAYLPKRKGDYYAKGGFIPNAIHTFGGDKEMVMVLEEYPNGYFEIINKAGDIKNVHYTYITTLNNYKKFAKGGRTKIEYEGVEFTPQMYKGIMGDKDKDGVPNADDVEPSNPSITQKIEENTPFTETFNKLLTKKKKYDDTMYSIVDKMEKNLPEKYNIIARTKTPFSILKKLVDKRIDGANGLDDIIGTTIATNNNKELREVSSMIGTKAGDEGIFGKVIEIDDKFKKPKCGYTAIHYVVEYEGRPVEVQLKTKRMKKLNEFSHPFYKREDLDCDGMGELSEIVTMADNGSEEAKKEFEEIYANKDLMRSMISLSGKKFAEGGEVEWFDYSNIGLKELPFDLDRYFIKTPDTVEIDLDLLEPTRAREKGVKNANKYMRMAYDMEIDRRKPISVYERDGRLFVYDGNSTIANAKNSGWDSIYVEMMDDPNEEMFQDGGVIEIEEDFSNVPAELMEVFGMMDIDEEGSYSEMERLREMARKRGYDFDYDLGGQPIDYWTIPKEYMAKGGEVMRVEIQPTILDRDKNRVNKMYRGRVEGSKDWEWEDESSDKLRRYFIDKYGGTTFLFMPTKDFTNYAKGGKTTESEREQIPTSINKSNLTEFEHYNSILIQLSLFDRWITKKEFNKLKDILKRYNADGYFSSVRDSDGKRFKREDIDINILPNEHSLNIYSLLDELDDKFDWDDIDVIGGEIDFYKKGGKLPKKTALGRSRDWHKRSSEPHELAYQKRKRS